MKPYSYSYFAMVFLVGLVCTSLTWWANDYMRAFDREVEIVEKFVGSSTGKHSHMQFIVVYKTDDGRYADSYLKPSEFHQLKVGDKVNMTLREFDLQQTPLNNFLWFFLAMVVYVLGSIAMFIGLVGFCSRSVRQYFSEKQS